VVGKGIQADLRHLDPDLHGAPVPLLVSYSLRLDGDDQLPRVSLQRRAQVDAHFGQRISSRLGPDGVIHHLATRRILWLVIPVALLQVARKGRPVGGLHLVDAHLQTGVVDGVYGQGWLLRSRIEGNQRLVGPIEPRLCRSYLEAQALILAQLLARDRRESVEEISSGFLAQLIRKGGGTLSGYARKSAAFWHHTITLAEDEVEKLIGLLVKDREISEKEGRTLKKEILGYADNLKGWIGEKVDQRVAELLQLMKLPTREQVNRLTEEVAALRRRIDQLAPPPPEAGEAAEAVAAPENVPETPPAAGEPAD
jgi:polyhydroxyalkanoate synthesis regulator phasin